MEPNFREIEQKWQKRWVETGIYKTEIDLSKPKYYVLDMFPYPSGAGLHVGHPLGYIASDIVTRYKRLKGFNVLHPMGFDAFGLPAEQYAIQTGRHPAVTTAENTARYKQQLDSIGFSYDWSREVNTSSPDYYKWTQWIFLNLFDSWYNVETERAESISILEQRFTESGSSGIKAACGEYIEFTAEAWGSWSEKEKRAVLMQYRLAYQDYSTVNWCEALGTVLANDEVKDGISERGGHPVEKRRMRQWFLRITAYAERLLRDLETLEWTDSMKDMQRNWIGKSEGAMLRFQLDGHAEKIEVFTTRPDTLFGVDFLTLAPEHELVPKITTGERKQAIERYVKSASNRSERERMADVKRISGEFTGAYVIHPFTGAKIPVWVGDYVLAGYGTGAVMAVPAGDQRDWDFANHFGLPITPINEGVDISEKADPTKEAKMINSGFLNGLTGHQAIKRAIEEIEKLQIGSGKVNYRLRDAGFSRQRYWGEPFPIVYKDETAYPLSVEDLPLELPVLEDFRPTGQPESPLAKSADWINTTQGRRETDTMPGYAGSSWYFLRYMDARNSSAFVGKEAENYWQDVDLYIGGTEHAVGHLLYARFWQKFLFDIGNVTKNEPFKRLVNQGMILGRSSFVYRLPLSFVSEADGQSLESITIPPVFVSFNRIKEVNQAVGKFSKGDIPTIDHPELHSLLLKIENDLKHEHQGLRGKLIPAGGRCIPLHVDVSIVHNDVLDLGAFRKSNAEFQNAVYILEDLKYICGWEVEKMSKSKFNVVNPDDIIAKYGADTLRLYEMFLGPLEQSKPWNTNGIEGVHRFLKKLWNLFYDEPGNLTVTEDPATEAELRILHKTIKKTEEDIERFSFNTSVSSFMICVNELTELKCRKTAVLKELLITLSPFAPHITEELWHALNQNGSVTQAQFPVFNERFLKESTVLYPVAFNGKVRYQITVSASATANEVEHLALQHEEASKYIPPAGPKKVIVVPGRMVNIVV
jgi:leucyl-tRNA synthetase